MAQASSFAAHHSVPIVTLHKPPEQLPVTFNFIKHHVHAVPTKHKNDATITTSIMHLFAGELNITNRLVYVYARVSKVDSKPLTRDTIIQFDDGTDIMRFKWGTVRSFMPRNSESKFIAQTGLIVRLTLSMQYPACHLEDIHLVSSTKSILTDDLQSTKVFTTVASSYCDNTQQDANNNDSPYWHDPLYVSDFASFKGIHNTNDVNSQNGNNNRTSHEFMSLVLWHLATCRVAYFKYCLSEHAKLFFHPIDNPYYIIPLTADQINIGLKASSRSTTNNNGNGNNGGSEGNVYLYGQYPVDNRLIAYVGTVSKFSLHDDCSICCAATTSSNSNTTSNNNNNNSDSLKCQKFAMMDEPDVVNSILTQHIPQETRKIDISFHINLPTQPITKQHYKQLSHINILLKLHSVLVLQRVTTTTTPITSSSPFSVLQQQQQTQIAVKLIPTFTAIARTPVDLNRDGFKKGLGILQPITSTTTSSSTSSPPPSSSSSLTSTPASSSTTTTTKSIDGNTNLSVDSSSTITTRNSVPTTTSETFMTSLFGYFFPPSQQQQPQQQTAPLSSITTSQGITITPATTKANNNNNNNNNNKHQSKSTTTTHKIVQYHHIHMALALHRDIEHFATHFIHIIGRQIEESCQSINNLPGLLITQAPALTQFMWTKIHSTLITSLLNHCAFHRKVSQHRQLLLNDLNVTHSKLQKDYDLIQNELFDEKLKTNKLQEELQKVKDEFFDWKSGAKAKRESTKHELALEAKNVRLEKEKYDLEQRLLSLQNMFLSSEYFTTLVSIPDHLVDISKGLGIKNAANQIVPLSSSTTLSKKQQIIIKSDLIENGDYCSESDTDYDSDNDNDINEEQSQQQTTTSIEIQSDNKTNNQNSEQDDNYDEDEDNYDDNNDNSDEDNDNDDIQQDNTKNNEQNENEKENDNKTIPQQQQEEQPLSLLSTPTTSTTTIQQQQQQQKEIIIIKKPKYKHKNYAMKLTKKNTSEYDDIKKIDPFFLNDPRNILNYNDIEHLALLQQLHDQLTLARCGNVFKLPLYDDIYEQMKDIVNNFQNIASYRYQSEYYKTNYIIRRPKIKFQLQRINNNNNNHDNDDDNDEISMLEKRIINNFNTSNKKKDFLKDKQIVELIKDDQNNDTIDDEFIQNNNNITICNTDTTNNNNIIMSPINKPKYRYYNKNKNNNQQEQQEQQQKQSIILYEYGETLSTLNASPLYNDIMRQMIFDDKPSILSLLSSSSSTSLSSISTSEVIPNYIQDKEEGGHIILFGEDEYFAIASDNDEEEEVEQYYNHHHHQEQEEQKQLNVCDTFIKKQQQQQQDKENKNNKSNKQTTSSTTSSTLSYTYGLLKLLEIENYNLQYLYSLKKILINKQDYLEHLKVKNCWYDEKEVKKNAKENNPFLKYLNITNNNNIDDDDEDDDDNNDSNDIDCGDNDKYKTFDYYFNKQKQKIDFDDQDNDEEEDDDDNENEKKYKKYKKEKILINNNNNNNNNTNNTIEQLKCKITWLQHDIMEKELLLIQQQDELQSKDLQIKELLDYTLIFDDDTSNNNDGNDNNNDIEKEQNDDNNNKEKNLSSPEQYEELEALERFNNDYAKQQQQQHQQTASTTLPNKRQITTSNHNNNNNNNNHKYKHKDDDDDDPAIIAASVGVRFNGRQL